MVVAHLSVGEVLGEMSLFSVNKTRQATVVAGDQGCELVAFPAYSLQLLLDVPVLSNSLARRNTRNKNRITALTSRNEDIDKK